MTRRTITRALRTLLRGALSFVGGALLSASLILGVSALSPAQPLTTPVPTPTATPVVTTIAPEPEATASSEAPAPATHAIDDIREMSVAADGVISPPDFDHVFRVRGLPDGPVWLAAHARSPGRGTAPGNVFLTFQVGDRIEALGGSWRIVERWSAAKGAAGEQGPYSDPQAYSDHLILVSCLPREGGAALSNTWLVAEPIGAP